MFHFLRLIRPLNLLIIAFTMYMMRYFVVGGKWMDWQGNVTSDLFCFTMTHFDFFLLVISTMFVAGAGYIINDYFDIRIDRINKPEKVIVGKFIKKRVAMLWHTLLNFFAIGIAVYLTFKYYNFWPLIFHLSTTFGLWMYSLSLKRQFLSGNLTISLMAGMVVLLSGLADLPDMILRYREVPEGYPFTLDQLSFSWKAIWVFTGFAFLTTLIREVQKDLADVKGDEAQKCKTVPIVWGISKTKKLVTALVVILLVPLFLIVFALQLELYRLIFISFAVIVPILYSGFLTSSANDRNGFLGAAKWMKFAMFAGVLYSLFLF
ncbi:MAG: geranylgeranylglycerol-phosphate geranylgeranyltransferase [Flavobacteriales bacterium]